MAAQARSRFDELVKEDAVHRSVYTDPAIFGQEMCRIYGRTWVFVAHESEVRNPGDFKTDEIAGQPIIVSRHSDGRVYALFNTCRHRGALVCNLPSGRSSYFRCPYHSWTYRTNGELALVPNREGFGSDFDLGEHGLLPVPRVASYRGFIFASLRADGPDLDEHLGRARHYIDIFVDRAPAGEVESTTPIKYAYPGNWKLQIENMSDNYHPQYVHASAFGTRIDGMQDSLDGAWNAVPNELELQRVERSFAAGHGLLDYRGSRALVTHPQRYPQYVAQLTERHGGARADELACADLHLMVYPNLILHTLYAHYRVIRPIAVDRTEINTYPCRLVGAEDAINEALLRATALHVSPAGRVQVDDLETFARVQRGLRSEAMDWVLFKMRGIDEHVNEDGELECRFLSEMIPRGYYREWRRLMAQDP